MKTWMDILDPANKTPIPEITAYIEAAAKEVLGTLTHGEWLTTVDLANRLWHPDDVFPDSPGDTFLVRSRLYTFLGHVDRKTKRPTLLPDWRRRGPMTRSAFGKYIKPWHWYNALATEQKDEMIAAMRRLKAEGIAG
jgi:hypothetical protein